MQGGGILSQVQAISRFTVYNKFKYIIKVNRNHSALYYHNALEFLNIVNVKTYLLALVDYLDSPHCFRVLLKNVSI